MSFSDLKARVVAGTMLLAGAQFARQLVQLGAVILLALEVREEGKPPVRVLVLDPDGRPVPFGIAEAYRPDAWRRLTCDSRSCGPSNTGPRRSRGL